LCGGHGWEWIGVDNRGGGSIDRDHEFVDVCKFKLGWNSCGFKERPVNAGLSFKVSKSGRPGPGARDLFDRRQFFAWNSPKIWSPGSERLRRGEQSGIIMPGDHQIAAHGKNTAFFRLQLDRRRTADVDARAIVAILISADDYGWRQTRGGESNARRDIGCRGIFGGGGMRRHYDLTGDEVDDPVAIRVGDHPACCERIGQRCQHRIRLEGDQRGENH
jgi:hypothetical protein